MYRNMKQSPVGRYGCILELKLHADIFSSELTATRLGLLVVRCVYGGRGSC